MYSIFVPKNDYQIDQLLSNHKISFERLNEHFISVKGILSKELLKEISHYENVYIVNDEKPLNNYIKNNDIRLIPNINQKATSNYTPTDLKKIYNIPNVTNKNRINIGIIQLGGGFRQNDLDVYWKYIGLTGTKPIVNAILVDGAKNSPGLSNADYEVYLDIEVVGGICPNSNINVYFAPNTYTSFFNAIAKSINNNDKVISISWGAAEQYYTSYTLNSFNTLFATAVSKGITICVASGDSGYKDNGTTISVDFPASSPNVLAVGGTSLTAKNNVYKSELAWTGSGGGYSNYFPKPNYQANIQKSSTKRCIPDVCANADPNTGYIIYLNGKYYVIGGTSASAPFWCGFLASIGYSKFLNKSIYNLIGTNCFNDIISGSNGYPAIIGYDLCTGIGSPNLTNLYNKIK